MNRKNKELNLLPNYFKKIGTVLLSLSILGVIVLKLFVELQPDAIDLIKESFLTTAIVSMLIISLSSNKIEDEMTMKIRVTAYTFAFITGTITTVIAPFVGMFWGEEFTIFQEAKELLIFMCMMYFVGIYSIKKAM